MNINLIKEHIKNKKKYKSYDEFSVLIPLIYVDNEIHVLFEKRALTLNSQPGEICFPGGKKEDGETPSYSSLRETIEELQIPEHKIEILNNLGHFHTSFNYKINIFLGYIKDTKISDINYNKSEVDSIFTIPLKHLKNQNPLKYKLDIIMNFPDDFPYEKIINGKEYSFKRGSDSVYFYEFKDIVVWGITGKITKIFLDNIKELSI